MAGSIMGHTLRRPSHEYDTNTPRSLTRGSGNAQQYYYGWQSILQSTNKNNSNVNKPTTISDDDERNLNNVTICPPGRTYCF